MPLYGVDISHHQGSFPVEKLRGEGFSFAIFKATEGSTFVDSRFAANLAAARKSGIHFAAYHYQRAGVSASAQVANIKRVVPRDCPVIPDVEANSGNVSLTREIVKQLKASGYRVPLLYLPRWYWDGHIGRPSLSGLPPLWSSRYVNATGYASKIYESVPSSYWDGYGGLQVAVLQYSSSATVAGRTPIDVNAYRGTRAQLAALLTGTTPPKEDDDMPSAQEIAKAVLTTDGIIPNINSTTKNKYWTLASFISHIEDTQDKDSAAIKQIGKVVAAQAAAIGANSAAIEQLARALAEHDQNADPEQFAAAVREAAEVGAKDALEAMPLAAVLVRETKEEEQA